MQQVATLATEFANPANSERQVVSFATQSQGVSESNERHVFADGLAREIAKQEKNNQSREQHFDVQGRKEQSVAKEKQRLVDAEMQKDAQDAKKQALQSEQQQNETGKRLSEDSDKPHNTQWDELLFAAKNTSTELQDGTSNDATDTQLTDNPITDKVVSDTIQLATKQNRNDLANGKAVGLDTSTTSSESPYSEQISSKTAGLKTESLAVEVQQINSASTLANNVINTTQDNSVLSQLDSSENTSVDGENGILTGEPSVVGERAVLDEALNMPDKTLLAAALSDALQDKQTSHVRHAEGFVSPLDNAKNLAQVNHVSGGANNPNVMDLVLSMTTQLTPEQVESLAQQTATKLAQAGAFEGQNETAKTQFIGQFKAALGEIKEQLENGRMAGIDLRSLIQSALPASEASLGKAVEGITQQLQQNLPNIQHTLQQATQHNLQQVANGTEVIGSIQDIQRHAAETQQLSTEQTKTTTPSPSKALNMEKPEGMQQLTEKVRFMANNRQITADLRLDPADLGSMQIRVSMQGDTASVNFVVQNAQAREVLEQATARLSEMLSEQGIQLGESNIQQDNSSSDGSADDLAGFAASGTNALNSQFYEETEQDGNIIAEQRITNGNIGGIDFYA